MPRLLDTLSRTNTVTNAVNDLLAADGAAGLTMRRIAAECRLSTAALGSHYGSREHLLRVAGYTTSAGLLDHQRQMVAVHGSSGGDGRTSVHLQSGGVSEGRGLGRLGDGWAPSRVGP